MASLFKTSINVPVRPEPRVRARVRGIAEAVKALLVSVVFRRDVGSVGVDVVEAGQVADCNGGFRVLDRGFPRSVAGLHRDC